MDRSRDVLLQWQLKIRDRSLQIGGRRAAAFVFTTDRGKAAL